MTVPYIYIQIIALASYALIFTSLLAAKKTALVYTYMAYILGFMFWTGGSLFMRLQVGPSMFFWFDMSILALFALSLLVYLFIYHYTHHRGKLLRAIWLIGTLIILVLQHFEIFLSRPEMIVDESGRTVFQYEMSWMIALPSIFFVLIILSVVRMILRSARRKNSDIGGLKAVVVGCVLLVVGNLASIIPGNIFPFDTLSGILNAVCLLYALYKKRLFKLTLLVSKNTLALVSVIVTGLCFVSLIEPITTFFTNNFTSLADYSLMFVTATMMVAIGFIYGLLRKGVDILFGKEEQKQAKSLEHFSIIAAQTLSTNDIMRELSKIIKDNIPVEKIYICLKEKNRFVAKFSSQPLDSISFSISADNPCVAYLNSEETSLIISDFKTNALYRSMWEEEKSLIDRLGISCIFALKNENEIVGLTLLTGKTKKQPYTYDDIVFLGAVSSISSIAVKNAELYERVYRESRVDSLTGLYNYKSFCEKIEEFSTRGKDKVISILFLDVDDFKLYNQLYGASEGDRTLTEITRLISYNTESLGTPYRYGGKVFVCLFPDRDAREVYNIAQKIRTGVASINKGPDRSKFKSITLSGGICVYPYAASSMTELINNADIALFNAKTSGKDRIVIYTNEARESGKDVNITIDSNGIGKSESIYSAYETTILALTAAIDAKDHYTFAHSQNVAKHSATLASAMGMNRERVRIIYEAALLHDIGKISIPDNILCKQGALTDEEYVIMKSHVNNSIEIIRHLPSMDYVIPAAVGHHERWDGKGYPRGLKGEEIPVEARCLAIADAFDAMTSNRHYRRALPVDFAAEEILKGAGTQFDPEMAQVFVALIRQNKITAGAGTYDALPV